MRNLALALSLFCCVPAFAGGKKQTPAPSQGAPSEAAQVWISRPDGSLSCGMKEAQSLETAAAELEKAGVRVFGSAKGNDGKMRAQMCGLPTGNLNRFKILEADVEKAKGLGFAFESAANS